MLENLMYPHSHRPPVVAAPDCPLTRPLLNGLEIRVDIAFTMYPASEFSKAFDKDSCACALVCPTKLLFHPGLSVIPGAGLSARASTPSHRLIADAPLENIRRIRVDPEAADLTPYVELLFAERGISLPEFVVRKDDPEASACAALVITTDTPSATRAGYDLGVLWHETTGLPLVIGAWICTAQAPCRSLRQILGDAARRGEDAGLNDGSMTGNSPYYYHLLSEESDSIRQLHALARRHAIGEASVESIVFC